MKPLASKGTEDVVPILSLDVPDAGAKMLGSQFGFTVARRHDNGEFELSLGDQRIYLRRTGVPSGPMLVHHMALRVPNVDTAMNEVLNRGARLSKRMTPDGPREIDEFWDAGVRYVFFEGPEGTLIELCARRDCVSEFSDWGQDHIGINCHDMMSTKALCIARGCVEVAEYRLEREEGVTSVSFLKRGSSMIELFQAPDPAALERENRAVSWTGCSL